VPEGKQIQRMFTGIAGRYDILNHLLSLGTDFYWWYRMSRASGADMESSSWMWRRAPGIPAWPWPAEVRR